MATTSRLATLLVRIAGDADDLDGDLEAGMARAESTVTRMGDRISSAATAIGAGVGAGLAAGITQSLETEAAGDKLAAQLGASGDRAAELGRIQGDVYAAGWGESLDEVGAAVAATAQNIEGLNDVDLERLSTKALALAKTFDQDVTAAASAAGQMMRTGMAGSADEAFDIITAGFQAGADRGGDFLDTIIGGADNLKTFGFDGKTATGLIVQGLNAGAESAESVTGLFEELVGNVSAGGDDLAETFTSLGLDAKQMTADLSSGGPAANAALDQLLDSLRSLEDPIQRNAIVASLFGEEGAAMQNTLMAIDPSSAVQALGEFEGAADGAMTTISDSPAVALESFKRTAMQKLGEIAGVFVNFGMQNQGFVQPLIIVLGVLAGAILAVRVGTVAWTAAQTAWKVATGIATAAQWAFNAAMSANPLSLIILAVAALTAGIVALYMKSETAREIINGAFSGIWTAIQFVYNWVRDNWPLLLTILTGPIGFAVSQIVKHWDSIRNGASAIVGWVRDNWPLLLSILTGPIGAAVIQIVTHWTEIKNAGIGVLNWFKELPGNLGSALSSVGQIIYAPFKSAFNSVASAWNNSVGKVGFSVPGWVPKLGGKSWSIPDIPLLAAGGIIGRGGPAVVGDAGPELLDLPRGARVTPLPRGVTSGGGGAGGGRVVIDVTGADAEFKKLIRRMVKVDGRGSVQTAFGQG